MDLQIKTRNIPLTDNLRAYIEQRTDRLDRLGEDVVDATMELRAETPRSGGEQTVAQLTIVTRSAILRAEETNHDLHRAIDLAVDRMERRITRFRDKQVFNRRRRKMALSDAPVVEPSGDAVDADADERPTIAVRRKRFPILPMDESEAIEQMELLGHDFFVFFNSEDEQINVLYRRKDGRYGIIQPELA